MFGKNASGRTPTLGFRHTPSAKSVVSPLVGGGDRGIPRATPDRSLQGSHLATTPVLAKQQGPTPTQQQDYSFTATPKSSSSSYQPSVPRSAESFLTKRSAQYLTPSHTLTPSGQRTIAAPSSVNNATKRKREDSRRGFTLEQSSDYSVEAIGAYPDAVWSAIASFESSSGPLHVEVDHKGWATCLLGLDLYVWKQKGPGSAGDSRRVPQVARLSLSPEFESSSSALVRVIESPRADGSVDPIQVISISTQGSILFWPKVKPQSSSDRVPLQLVLGEEEQVTQCAAAGTLGIICGTSKGNIWLIARVRDVIKAKILERSEGIFSSLTKMLWLAPAPATNSTVALAAVSRPRGQDGAARSGVYQMTEKNLYCWCISRSDHQEYIQPQYEWEAPLQSLVRDQLVAEYYRDPSLASSEESCKVWLLAMEAVTDSSLVVLGASRVEPHSPVVFTLHQVIIGGAASRFQHSLGPFGDGNLRLGDYLRLTSLMVKSEEELDRFLAVKMVRGSGASGSKGIPIHVLWPRTEPMKVAAVLLHPVSEERRIQVFEIKSVSGPRMAGAGAINGHPSLILFSATSRHGILAVSSLALRSVEIAREASRPNTRSASPRHVAFSDMEGDQQSVAWFLQRMKADLKTFDRQTERGREDTASEWTVEGSSRGAFEQAVGLLSQQILDSKPASGQRWAQEEGGEESDVTPQLTKYHLETKKNKHQAFLAYLQVHLRGLYDLLGSETQEILYQHREKLLAALALCRFQDQLIRSSGSRTAPDSSADRDGDRVLEANQGALLLRAMLRSVLQRGHTEDKLRAAGLSIADAFYFEVTRVQDILRALQTEVLALLDSPGASIAASLRPIDAIAESNSVFSTLLDAVRESGKQYETHDESRPVTFSSWFSSDELRVLLTRQLELTVAALGFRYTERRSLERSGSLPEMGMEAILFSQLEKLGEHLLAIVCGTQEPQFASSFSEAERRQAKSLVIEPLVLAERNSIAFSFAERFRYFEALITLCLREDDVSSRQPFATVKLDISEYQRGAGAAKLERYCQKFREDGFCVVLFEWLAGERPDPWSPTGHSLARLSILLAQPASIAEELGEFLKKHRTLRSYLWLHQLRNGDYEAAAGTLYERGSGEPSSSSLKKTLLSMAKLAVKASNGTSKPPVVAELRLVAVQEVLFQGDAYQGGVDLSAPQPPEKLIELCLKALPGRPRTAVSKQEVSQSDLLLFAVECIDAMGELGYGDETLHGLLLQIWQTAISVDDQIWEEIVRLHSSSESGERLEKALLATLFATVLATYRSSVERGELSSAAIPHEKILRELCEGEKDAVFKRRLLGMAINLVSSRVS